MIQVAGKYSDVRAANNAAPSRSARPMRANGGPRVRSSPGPSTSPRPTAPALFIPKPGQMVSLPEYFWRELREGGVLHKYLGRERADTARRYRRVARAMDGFKQNNRSEWRLLAAVPARDFHRWRGEDPNFWEDDSNLKSLRRDNPDAQIFV